MYKQFHVLLHNKCRALGTFVYQKLDINQFFKIIKKKNTYVWASYLFTKDEMMFSTVMIENYFITLASYLTK